MRSQTQSPFGRRVLLLSLLSAGAALLLATIGFVLYEYVSSRNEIQERLATIAAVVADNSAAALAFGDERAAAEVLATLKSVPVIRRATLFTSGRMPFAIYPRGAPQPEQPILEPVVEHVEFYLDHVEVRQTVRLETRVVGWLLLEAELRPLYEKLAWYGLTSLLLVALALGASTVLLGTLRRRLTDTEMMLAELTRTLEERVKQRTAELEGANRELESFGYSVSHDLRAPVRAMAGFAGILREDYGAQLPEEALRGLKRIQDNAEYMGQLIDDLLELSRTGRTRLTLARVEMHALATSVVQDLGAVLAHADVRIGPMPNVQADATLLRQVWINLVANAAKYSRNASNPLIEIGGELRGRWAEYFVRDNGAGFDMLYANKLFRLFERLHASTEYEGTGVGLAIVQRIVQRHHGEVEATGSLGEGATFRFRLPAQPSQTGKTSTRDHGG